ncbi:MAG: NUDIX hydrolase [Pseudooceanicola sp.]|nr:NUDIX hydrolase [Pseudooceanicola sp.]
MEFRGAKLALFLGGALLVIRRDRRADIPWPGRWDLPGGGREGTESPVDCVLRETLEEVGLALVPEDLRWGRAYPQNNGVVWFFAAELPGEMVERVRFGDEGEGWRLMSYEEYAGHPAAIPHFVARIGDYLEERGADKETPAT